MRAKMKTFWTELLGVTVFYFGMALGIFLGTCSFLLAVWFMKFLGVLA
jgi:hypothetical protein